MGFGIQVAAKKVVSKSFNKTALTLTQAALDKIKEMLHQNGEHNGIRIGVKQRGCSGMTYTMDFCNDATSKKYKLDEVICQDGVKVIIDCKAQLSLLGSEMDFVRHEQGLSEGFVFRNANIRNVCGCGESFNM